MTTSFDDETDVERREWLRSARKEIEDLCVKSGMTGFPKSDVPLSMNDRRVVSDVLPAMEYMLSFASSSIMVLDREAAEASEKDSVAQSRLIEATGLCMSIGRIDELLEHFGPIPESRQVFDECLRAQSELKVIAEHEDLDALRCAAIETARARRRSAWLLRRAKVRLMAVSDALEYLTAIK